MEFDLVIKNGNIITSDPANKKASWMACNNGRIEGIGSDANYPKAARKMLDLGGKTVVPGFIDTHVHGTLTGEALSAVDVGKAKSVDEILSFFEIHCKKKSDKKIITGTGFSQIDLLNHEAPTAAQLDEISKDQIIVIYDKSYHGCILNSAGLKAAGITPDMPGVGISQNKMTGKIDDDTSYFFAIRNIMKDMDEATIKGYMRTVNDYAISKGVTSIHSLDGGDYLVDMPTWILHRDEMDLHIVNYWETLDFQKTDPFNLPRIGGCLCLDGTRVLRTMALLDPYADMPSQRGTLYYKEEEVYNFVKAAHQRNMQCSMHATGDRAIDQYIYILNQVCKEEGRKDLRHRIEHFSMPTDRHIEMAAELQLALPMQPVFPRVWDSGEDSLYKQRFGKDRAKRVEPIGKILRAGGKVCGGSDSPVTMIDPIRGIDACVNADYEERRTTIEQALEIFTINGAWAAHEEGERGSLACGKYADFVVLSQNPYACGNSLMNVEVEKTFIRGREVFCKEV